MSRKMSRQTKVHELEDGWRLLSIRNADGTELGGFDEISAAKNEAGLESALAFEVYPPTDSLVNFANMRHLLVAPDNWSQPWPDVAGLIGSTEQGGLDV